MRKLTNSNRNYRGKLFILFSYFYFVTLTHRNKVFCLNLWTIFSVHFEIWFSVDTSISSTFAFPLLPLSRGVQLGLRQLSSILNLSKERD